MPKNVKQTSEMILSESLPDDELFDEELPDLYAEAEQAPDYSPIELKLNSSHCGERLDKSISGLLPEYSRSRLQQWIEAGHVSVDGKPAKGKMTMLGDERIVIQPQPAPDDNAFKAEQIELEVVYEDASLIVINKPAGLVVHPAAGNWSGTLLNGLLFRWPQLRQVPRAGIVHRLDKDTSGLMVVAKTMQAHTDLVRQLQERSVSREYYALVWGTPYEADTINAAMMRHPRDRIKMSVSKSIHAKVAITHYQVLDEGMLEKYPVSLIACQLETGRTHQIRVHMASIGFPLVGDPLYGKQHLARFFPRQALQARKLGLIHPLSGEQIEWEVGLAQDFVDLLEQAGIEQPGAEFPDAELV